MWIKQYDVFFFFFFLSVCPQFFLFLRIREINEKYDNKLPYISPPPLPPAPVPLFPLLVLFLHLLLFHPLVRHSLQALLLLWRVLPLEPPRVVSECLVSLVPLFLTYDMLYDTRIRGFVILYSILMEYSCIQVY